MSLSSQEYAHLFKRETEAHDLYEGWKMEKEASPHSAALIYDISGVAADDVTQTCKARSSNAYDDSFAITQSSGIMHLVKPAGGCSWTSSRLPSGIRHQASSIRLGPLSRPATRRSAARNQGPRLRSRSLLGCNFQDFLLLDTTAAALVRESYNTRWRYCAVRDGSYAAVVVTVPTS